MAWCGGYMSAREWGEECQKIKPKIDDALREKHTAYLREQLACEGPDPGTPDWFTINKEFS